MLKAVATPSGTSVLNALASSGQVFVGTKPRSLLGQIQAYCTAQGIPLPACNLSPRSAFSDTAIATPAVDGGVVGSLRDLTGNGYNAAQATTAKQPIYRGQGLNGIVAGIDYSANKGSGTASVLITAGNIFASARFSSGFTIYAVTSSVIPQPSPSAGQILGSWNAFNDYIGSGGNAFGNISCKFNGTELKFSSVAAYVQELAGVKIAAWDGANATVGLNGRYFSAAAAGTLPTGNFQFGNIDTGQFGYQGGCLGDCFIFPGKHTAAQMDAISALLNADAGVVKPAFLFDGDSLTLGQGVSTGAAGSSIGNYAYKMCQMLGAFITAPTVTAGPQYFLNQVQYINRGEGGATIANKITEAQSAPYNNTNWISGARGTKQSIAFIWLGTNSLGQSGDNLSAAAAFAQLQTLIGLYRAAGATTIAVGTTIVRDATNAGAGFEAKRLAFNSLIRAAQGSLYDILMDFGGNAILGNIATLGNTTWFQSDNIHLTDQGQTLCAQIAATAVGVAGASSFISPSPQNAAPTTQVLNGTTSGRIEWSQIDQRTSSKEFIASFIGYENNSVTNQTITFPTPFINTPLITSNNTTLTITASATTMTITAPNNATLFNGAVLIQGQ